MELALLPSSDLYAYKLNCEGGGGVEGKRTITGWNLTATGGRADRRRIIMLIVAFIADKSETIALAIILYGVHVSSSTSQYSMACIAIRLIEPDFGKS